MDELAAGTARRPIATSGMTNVRWRIFFLILGTVAINYIDRASLSVAMPMISHEFSISPAIQGLLLSSFFWTYCLMQIPGGMLADRFLPRLVIAGATIGWGAFAALAAASTGWITMLLTRLGLGLAEGPIYPAGAKLIGLWMTPTERGRAAALLDGGAPLGTALGSLIIAGLIAALGSWRLAFLAAGLATMACGGFAWFYIRNHPHEHGSVNPPEREHIQDGLDRSAADAGPSTSMTAVFRCAVDLVAVRRLVLFQFALVWFPHLGAKLLGQNARIGHRGARLGLISDLLRRFCW